MFKVLKINRLFNKLKKHYKTYPEYPKKLPEWIEKTEMIKFTPARNIYDLIEVYVPGAIWMIHEEGPHMGIRGIIVNRNYKYLLLLNGRNLNNKGHFGAKSELEAWDLNDIERIEIIRGPGSVTYGPGAVGGVINIITYSTNNQTGVCIPDKGYSRSAGWTLIPPHPTEWFPTG